ncbi:MAG: nucleotidyltransferase family protein [Planctomycetes bacterium]|nr:nucleotidyltransferase family protein [Planctomycetota bacterium]
MGEFRSTLGVLGWLPDSGRNSEQHYQKTVGGFTIHLDLHTAIPYLDRAGLERFRSMAQPTRFGNTSGLIPSAEDALIYSAADAIICHAHVTDVCLTDISLIIRKHSTRIDWAEVVRQAKQHRLEATLYYVFSIANRKMNAGIPDWVLAKIKPSGQKALEVWFYRRFIGNGLSDDLAPVLRFITRPRRFKLLLDSFFPPSDFMMRRYGLTGKNTSFVFYPIRLLSHFRRIVKIGFLIINKM